MLINPLRENVEMKKESLEFAHNSHTVEISLHRDDYQRAEAAARALGYDLASFIKLTVHQQSAAVLSGKIRS